MFRSLRQFVDEQTWLDTLASPIEKALKSFYTSQGEQGSPKKLQNFLNGVWLGHPLHPMLTDVPIGAWTATLVLDTLGSLSDNESLETAADLTLATGLAAGYASAASGLTDWMDTYGEEQRLGLLHGLIMTTSVLAYSGALLARLGGSRSTGVALANVGYAIAAGGAYLGGDEVYDIGYGVNHTAFQHGPSKYVPVMPEAELQPETLTKSSADGVTVMLAKVDGQVYALDDTCVHAGCSLAGGTLQGTTVTCPCHGSQYDVRDGSVLNGPATMPEPAYDVRIAEGMIEVKRAE